MLIITNGGAAASLAETAIPDATVLSWDDVLHDGPVNSASLHELSKVRADFIESTGWLHGSETSAREMFNSRDNTLRSFADHDEVCLFFEHDMYDQLQLAQLLHFFHHSSGIESELTLAVDSIYIGEQTAKRVKEMLDARKPVSKAELSDGAIFWTTFASNSHVNLNQHDYSISFLNTTAERVLQEYPSVFNGMSRSRMNILEALSRGPLDPVSLFVECSEKEEARYLGDASFWTYVTELERCQVPLLKCSPGPFRAPDFGEGFRSQRISLTQQGEEVRAGKIDNIEINNIDMWIGGVHLTGDNGPRWNGLSSRLIFPPY